MIRWILFHVLTFSFLLIPLGSQAAISEEYSGNRPTIQKPVSVVAQPARDPQDVRTIICNSKKVLGFGSRGYEVKALQTFLSGTGFGKNLTPATGFFGFWTRSGLIKYQKSLGLKTTGNLSPETRASFCK